MGSTATTETTKGAARAGAPLGRRSCAAVVGVGTGRRAVRLRECSPRPLRARSMLSQFKPFMTTARLDGFQHELKEINAGVRQTESTVVTGLPTVSGVGPPPSIAAHPTFASFDQQWPPRSTAP